MIPDEVRDRSELAKARQETSIFDGDTPKTQRRPRLLRDPDVSARPSPVTLIYENANSGFPISSARSP